jgi:hypothetical protein
VSAPLEELEQKLRGLSHSEAAISAIQAFSAELGNTSDRIRIFNADGGLVRAPIKPADALELGFNLPDDEFALLQGDIITTESAFFLGERVVGGPKYMVLNSSCDLVPGRREYAALLRIKEIRQGDREAKQKLGYLLKFSKRDAMYVPVLPQDDPDVLCNAVIFDGVCQISMSDLLLANRIASLSLVGWRVFGSFARTVLIRATDREGAMRSAIEFRPVQPTLGPDFTDLDWETDSR